MLIQNNLMQVYIFIGPIEAIVVMIIMWQYVGIATLAGIICLLLFCPFQGVMMKLFEVFRYEILQCFSSQLLIAYSQTTNSDHH